MRGRHAYGIAIASTNPESFYLGSEGTGMVNQFDYSTGRLSSSTPVLGSHVTALTAIPARAELGECYSPTLTKPDGGWLREQLEVDGECINLLNGIPVERGDQHHVPCSCS